MGTGLVSRVPTGAQKEVAVPRCNRDAPIPLFSRETIVECNNDKMDLVIGDYKILDQQIQLHDEKLFVGRRVRRFGKRKWL